MKPRRLSRDFFDRPTLIVAKELLGKVLVRKIENKIIRVIITETEAYVGPKDLASHASRGRTNRTEIMFGPPGHAYIYMIYGMYFCLNIVTEKNDYPAAVLIRAVKLGTSDWPLANINKNNPLTTSRYSLTANLNGPGKLCRFLKIDKSLNGEDVTTSKKLWFEDNGTKVKPSQIIRTKRIGIDYAGKYKDKLWRFMIK